MVRSLWQVVRSRPRVAASAAAVLLLALAAGGVYGFIEYQWRVGQEALKDEARVAEARRRLDWCLAVWPWSQRVPVHLLAARAARVNGDFDAAERHLQRCLKLQGGASDPVQLEFFLLRIQLGEADEVAPGLWRCVENNHPETPVILATLARSYMFNYRYQPALRCLNRWAEVEPDSSRPWEWRGWVFERMGFLNEALENYEHALTLNPDLVGVRVRVVELLLGKSRVPEALPHLERLRQQAPERPEVMARLGQCRFMQGGDHLPEARRLLEAAVRQLPDDPSALVALGKLELQEGNAAQAEAWLRHAIEVDPSDTESRYQLISALQSQGRTKEAAAAKETYLQTKALMERSDKLLQGKEGNPSRDPDLAVELGSILLRLGQQRLGLYWLHQALKVAPDHAAAHQALAEQYEKKGDREQADYHRRALKRG